MAEWDHADVTECEEEWLVRIGVVFRGDDGALVIDRENGSVKKKEWMLHTDEVIEMCGGDVEAFRERQKEEVERKNVLREKKDAEIKDKGLDLQQFLKNKNNVTRRVM